MHDKRILRLVQISMKDMNVGLTPFTGILLKLFTHKQQKPVKFKVHCLQLGLFLYCLTCLLRINLREYSGLCNFHCFFMKRNKWHIFLFNQHNATHAADWCTEILKTMIILARVFWWTTCHIYVHLASVRSNVPHNECQALTTALMCSCFNLYTYTV